MHPAPPLSSSTGVIFNIQSFSLHDGPGIRDVVFFKGCSLRCRWCSNPESLHREPELSHKAARCLGPGDCGLCVAACPQGAVDVHNGLLRRQRERCTVCGACVAACPAKAVTLMGRIVSVDDLSAAIHENDSVHRNSEGGITLSGGEPLLQAPFAAAVLRRLGAEGVHRAVETAGNVPWENMAQVCAALDLLIYDIKHLDAATHLAQTGCDNARILENLRRVALDFPRLPIWARTPVIPGVNDTEADIAAIAEHLRAVPGVQTYELLPYHRFGEAKYAQLGLPYALSGTPSVPDERMERLRGLAGAVAETATTNPSPQPRP